MPKPTEIKDFPMRHTDPRERESRALWMRRAQTLLRLARKWRAKYLDQEPTLEMFMKRNFTLMKRKNELFKELKDRNKRIQKLEEVLKVIASFGCCQTPGCSIDLPLCDPMMAKSVLEEKVDG